MKLHELLNLALDDLEKCEKDPDYLIDMGEWHFPYGGKCFVCLAGAMMAKSLGTSPHYDGSPEDFENCSELQALDCLRCGDVEQAYYVLGIESKVPDRRITPYSQSPDAFKKELRQLAKELENED